MINRDTLVISNPGTGKTTMISNEVINLIKEGVKPEKILCITFTNNAVGELQKSIDKLLIDNKIKNVTAYDVNIYTFFNQINNFIGNHGCFSRSRVGYY